MNSVIHISLGTNDAMRERLDRLRHVFSEACNFIAPIAKENHCWNRVALHHLSYHGLRERFPDLGSQMACNAIYSVCRSYRLLLNHPASPFLGKKNLEGQLPLIQFLETSPVFFDRHTLSLNGNLLSLFTLEGRLRFGVTLNEADEEKFRTRKLKEIQLFAHGSHYLMSMYLISKDDQKKDSQFDEPWPDYFVLMDQPGKQYLGAKFIQPPLEKVS